MSRLTLALLLAALPALAGSGTDAGDDLGLAQTAGDGGVASADGYELEEEEDDEPLDSLDPESEAANAGNSAGPTDAGLLYTQDLSDDQLMKHFVGNLPALGSISVGLAEAGRLINGVQMSDGDGWTVVSPENAWGTRETVVYLSVAARAVQERFPWVAPLRINHVSRKEGGHLRPHHSHQSGRDADLGFYYRAGMNPLTVRGPRETALDLPANWALVRAIATQTDPQVILVDRRVQKVLYDYASSIGEDKQWLDSLFNAGRQSLFQHVRRHRDHFHVRFYSARSQELGWRIQPLLARRKDTNFASHRVRPGDTLGHLAMHYGSGVKLIQRANGLSSFGLSVGRTLIIPLRGPCTHCPLPPQVVVPSRRVPPSAPGTPVATSRISPVELRPPPAPAPAPVPASVEVNPGSGSR